MHRTYITCLSLLVAASGFAQKISEAEKSKALLKKNLEQHIYFLASDKLEGRRTGTPGELKATNYLSNQYKKYGIQPKGDNKTYIQTFDINEGKEIRGTTFLKNLYGPLVINTDYWPFSFSGTGTFGNGQPMFYDLKTALESNKNNPHFDLLQHIQEKAKEAKTQASTALLVYNTSASDDSLAFSPKDKADVAPLPVIYLTPTGFKRIKNGDNIKGRVDLGDKIRQGHNVVAYIDNGAATTIVLGGHLDHLGYGEDHNSRNTGAPAIHNGADDNASGTAATVELARILKSRFTDSIYKKNNYLFINFSGEELGLYGSKYFVEHPTIDLSQVNYMINMDMIGRLSDSSNTLTIGGIGTSSIWGDVLGLSAQTPFSIKVDSSGTGPSDHTSFYRKDIPVLFFFTGLHTDYHKPSDDAEKINYDGETNIVNYIVDVIAKSSDKGKLAFLKTKEQSMGTGRFKVSIGIMPDYTFSGQGVRADGIVDGKAAQKAGLKTGDVIVQLGEHLVTSLETYMQALNRFSKGESTKVTIKRGTEILELPVTF